MDQYCLDLAHQILQQIFTACIYKALVLETGRPWTKMRICPFDPLYLCFYNGKRRLFERILHQWHNGTNLSN
ncbi:hypothetical protein I7I50_10469 [Histoplasma capsulatum G186AR]|nr:hypothetical protein I7I52_01708 [Histoplasma capsulatum]QSS69252.1 hypothetical protein I7I50_10469 [Histoplasma capsulatum G186AR]